MILINNIHPRKFESFQSPRSGLLLTRTNFINLVPIRSEKAGRFEKLLGFARSHSNVTRGSASLSCATTKHPSCFS